MTGTTETSDLTVVPSYASNPGSSGRQVSNTYSHFLLVLEEWDLRELMLRRQTTFWGTEGASEKWWLTQETILMIGWVSGRKPFETVLVCPKILPQRVLKSKPRRPILCRPALSSAWGMHWSAVAIPCDSSLALECGRHTLWQFIGFGMRWLYPVTDASLTLECSRYTLWHFTDENWLSLC